MNDSTQPEVLSSEESALWREAYLDTFIDTATDHYQRYVASPRQFSDGMHYEGYLWDCLREPSRITVERFRLEVERHSEVFVIADDHSRDRIPGARLFGHIGHTPLRAFGRRRCFNCLIPCRRISMYSIRQFRGLSSSPTRMMARGGSVVQLGSRHERPTSTCTGRRDWPPVFYFAPLARRQ